MSKALLEAAEFPGKRGLHFCTPVFSCQSSGGTLNFSGPRLPLLARSWARGLTTPPGWKKEPSPGSWASRVWRLRQSEAQRSRWLPQPGLFAGGQVGHRAGPGARHGSGRPQPHPGRGGPPGERAQALKTRRWRSPPGGLRVMEPRAGGATDPRGSRGGTGEGGEGLGASLPPLAPPVRSSPFP